MDTQNARLKAARRAAGFKTARAAWEKHKWNGNTYRAHEAGPREIGKAYAIQYAAAFGVPLMWLLTGLEDISAANQQSQGANAPTGAALTGANIGLRIVPVIDAAALGAMHSRTPHQLAELATGFAAVASEGLSENAYAFRVPDLSMQGNAPQALAPGDLVIVDRDAGIEPGRVVIAGLPGGAVVVRIYGEAPGAPGGPPMVTLTPVNQFFATTTHQRDALAFLHRVVAVQRSL